MNALKTQLIDLLLNVPAIERPNERLGFVRDLVSPNLNQKVDWQGSTHAFVSRLVALLAKERKQLLGFLDALAANNDWIGIQSQRQVMALRGEIAALSPQEWFGVFGPSDWTEWGALPDCPYRGLQAFQREHKDLFFGRQKFVDRLLKKVDAEQLVAVIGSSGSGKSSVVFAGLIPQLPENWEVVSFRPGKRPFESLAGGLLGRSSNAGEVRELAGRLREGKVTLGAISSTPQTETTLLVADQFEELYTLCSEWETRSRFLDCLLEAADNAPGFKLVLTMRADFYHYALRYRPFTDALEKAGLPLGPMDREELREAISRPAESRGVSLEVGLLELILKDIDKKRDEDENNSNGKQPPDKLPLLEFALKQLWEAADESNYPELTHKAYNHIGGLRLALGKYAEKVYGELQEENWDAKQIKQVFIQLVQPGEETGTGDTRRLATREEIGKENWDLVTRLNQEEVRLVVIGRGEVTETETLEVVHEVLISGWSRLTGWMDGNREFRVWQERLRGTLREWKEKDKDKGALLRGRRLAEAEGWLLEREEDISLPERGFIRESVGLRDREKRERERKLLLTIFGLATFSLVAAIGWWNTFVSGKNAELRARITTLENLADTSLEQQLNAIGHGRDVWNFKFADLNNRVRAANLLQKMFDSETWKEYIILDRHKGWVYDVSFSPDGNLIASASRDKTVRLWKPDGTHVGTLEGHQGIVRHVSFSPDGNLIASASSDNTVRLWKADGTTVATLPSSEPRVTTSKPDGTTVAPHTVDRNLVHHFSFSPDGKLIASASDDKTVRLWKLDGTPVAILQGHQNLVRHLSFSPNGKLIASASNDKTVRLWKPDGTPVATLQGHQNLVRHVSFSPDGNFIASASYDNTVRLWKADGTPVATLAGHQNWVEYVSFSSDSNLIASVSWDNTVRLWKADGTPVATLAGHQDSVFRVGFSPDGKLIASASADGTVRLWKPDGTPVATLKGHQGPIYNFSFSPNGKFITSAGDRTVRLWQLDGTTAATLKGHQDKVYHVHFSPDSKLITSASADKTGRLWKRNGTAVAALQGHQDEINHISFSPDGNLIASASSDNTVRLWKLDGTLVAALEGHQAEVNHVSFNPDSNLIASASTDNTVRLWKPDGTAVATLEGHQDKVYAVNFSPDGNLIASASFDNIVRLWKPDGTLVTTLEGHKGQVIYVSFSPNGNLIASASYDNTARLWKPDGTAVATLEGHRGPIYEIGFSPDSKLIASAGADNTVRLWKPDGTLDNILRGHQGQVIYVSFSPNGRLIASASADNTVRLWQPDGTTVATLEGHQNPIYHVNFSPDGNLIASASWDGTVRLWNLDLDSLLIQGCDWVRDYLNTPPNDNKKEQTKKICNEIK